MKNENILDLQRRAKKLMELSSDESDPGFVNEELEKIMNKFQKNPKIQHPHHQSENSELLNKCLALIQQNKQLKQKLEASDSKNARLHSELQKVRENNKQLTELTKRVELDQTNKKGADDGRKQDNNKSEEKQFMRKIARIEAEKEQCEKKCSALLDMLRKQKMKTKRLSLFIQDKLPSLQQRLGTLASKIDIKLESHYQHEFQL